MGSLRAHFMQAQYEFNKWLKGGEYDPARPSENYFEGGTSSDLHSPRVFMGYLQVPKPRGQMYKADSLSQTSLRTWSDNRGRTEELDSKQGLSDEFESADRHSALLKQPEIQDLVDSTAGLSTFEKINAATSFVHENIDYEFDENSWIRGTYNLSGGSSMYIPSYDEFQTTSETFARGFGDCDDYAIAKYDLLASMGVPEENMHLVTGWQAMGPSERTDQGVTFWQEGDPSDTAFHYNGQRYGGHMMLIVEDPDTGTYYTLNNDETSYMNGGWDIIYADSFRAYEEQVGAKYFIPMGTMNRYGSSTFTTAAINDPIHEIKETFGEPHSRDLNDFFVGQPGL